jgi:hypothetical protein
MKRGLETLSMIANGLLGPSQVDRRRKIDEPASSKAASVRVAIAQSPGQVQLEATMAKGGSYVASQD